jgi:CheY-like chemotaxis protein
VFNAVEATAPLIKSKRHHLEIDLPPQPIHLIGDETRLEQVVANLLNNAAKYTRPDGHINLSARREGEELEVRVKDTGIGMKEDILSRVFDLFAQADHSLERTEGGLGIGLTLVRSLVEMHGGSIMAKSSGLGEGSEFIVRLPLSNELPAPTSDTSPECGSTGSRSLRVLVVDDHRDSAWSTAQVLESLGHETSVVHDGPAALEMVSANVFDIILLDIGLPGMDGYQVAERIREIHGRKRPHLVALTGYGQDEDLVRSRKVGFDQHLVKPVMLETLHSLLENSEIGRDRAGSRSPSLAEISSPSVDREPS